MIKSNLPVKGTTSVERRFCGPQSKSKISNWLKAATKDLPRLEDCTQKKNEAVNTLKKETELCEYLKTVDPLISSKHVKKFLEEICL